MAGTRRFQITLGPFPASAQRLEFTFRCEHPGCDGGGPCCAGEPQRIALGRVRTAARRPSKGQSTSRRRNV
jgi:hypothetical protein